MSIIFAGPSRFLPVIAQGSASLSHRLQKPLITLNGAMTSSPSAALNFSYGPLDILVVVVIISTYRK